MSKKLILFLMVLLFGSTSFLRADELTVHDGTGTNAYVPVYGFYADAYLKCEMVFPAAELADMENGTINGITFYATSPATEAWTGTWQVFVAEVAEATISDFAGPGTVVYEGTLDGTQSSMPITFSAPYTYQGGNLLVGVYCTAKGNYKSVTWGGEAVTGASVQGYNYNDISAITATQRDFLPKTTFVYTPGSGPTPPTPPTPTGDITVTPGDAWALGYRPTNGWMEPFAVNIYNGGAPAIVEGSMSNTSGDTPFTLSDEINQTLETEEGIDFEVEWNTGVEGDYTEEFTLFYAESRDIITIPVTATIYEAGPADIVETAETITLSYQGGVAEFECTPENLHPNYFGGTGAMADDAVYQFTLTQDAKFTVNADGFIGIYNKVLDFHPTSEVEPVAMTITGSMTDQVLLAGQYYMIIAGENITTVEGTVTQIPAPTELTALAPADGAAGLEGEIVLTWEGGENATQYQVLFGTSPTSLPVVLDWTLVDDNYGTFDVTDLVENNTQYFWQIKAKNSNGAVSTPRWGFTTALDVPYSVTATEEEIFTDGSTTIKWKLNTGGGGFVGEITVADGTTTNSYIPVYGLWMDDYTRGEMIYPAEMLEEMEGGEITSLTYYISSSASGPWSGDVFNVYLMEVPETTFTSYYTSANATIVYTGSLDGQGTTMDITFDTPYTYEGGNLLVGIEETVCGTYKSCSFYGISATGASSSGYSSASLSAVTFNQRNFLPKTTFVCGGREVAQNRTFQGFNLYYIDNENQTVKVNDDLITEKQYTLNSVLPYNVNPGIPVAVTAVYAEGESEMSDPVMVKVSGYGKFTGTVTELISGAPIEGVNVKFNGEDEFGNNVMFEGTTNANGVYTINNVKAGSYTGTARLEDMEPAMQQGLTLAYATTETVDFVMHEVYKPVMSVTAEEMDTDMSRVKWSMTEILPVPVFPTPGGNTPGGGGGGGGTTPTTETFDFDDSSFQGWTTIDGGSPAGYGWQIGSTKLGSTGNGHNASADLVLSQSYDNNYGVVYPNNFLICPTKAQYTSVSLWACGQDASYAAEHFGIAVSTTGNTSASDFTMVQEWTIGSKGQGQPTSVTRSGSRAQSTWTEYTADLSAYAGQEIWVAVRHFNCSDMFYLDVDDITLTTGGKGTRDVQEYMLYRVPTLTENGEPINVEEIEDPTPYYITTVAGQTQYADFDWATMEPGLYQYGVSAVYPSPSKGGNTRDEVIIGDGTGTASGYIPTYNLYNYSCTNQIYTAEEIGGAGTINSIAFMPATVNTPSRNVNVYMVNTDKTSFAGDTDWVPVTEADLVYSGTVNWTANEWCTIELTNPFDFDGSNLCVVVNDLTGTWTTSNTYKTNNATAQAIRIYQDSAPYNPASPGSGTVLNVKNYIKLDITFGGSGNDNPVTPAVWSNVLPKDIWTTVTINALVPVGSPEGTKVKFHNTFEETNDIIVTLNETGCDTIWPFRKGEYTVTVELDGFTSNYNNEPVSIWGETAINPTFEEIYTPVTAVTATRMGYASWDEIVVPVNDRYAERYMVKLNDALYAETTDNFIQFDVEQLEVGTTYTVGVAVVYSTGMSIYKYATFTYADCTGASKQVEGLEATNTPGDLNIGLAWDGATPGPGPGPGPGPQPGTGTSFDFDDNTMMGWTSIDGDGDGNGWVSSANPGIYHNAGVNLAGTGHNSSQAYVISGSYANQTGQALTPNNFLVSPAKGAYTGITFYACAQDASYAAEHFGVAVSTTGNTSASDFTTIQEWTMTAKSEGAMSAGRTRQTRQGNWYQYSVDLSAYAGQDIWVAIRHFNCTDMFILNVDDIELTTPAKELAAGTIANAGTGYGAINYDRDGNWYYYDNGTNYDAIGLSAGGGFYWGIMLQANAYEGNRLTKISYFDYEAHTGTVTIYQGGTSAPGTQLYSQPYSVSGTEQYIEIEMEEAVEVDDTQTLWIVMHNNSGQYVAAIDAGPGVTYGSCISTDGASWYTTISAASGGQIDGNWNLRAYVESGSGPAPSAVVPNKYNIFVDGELVGATASKTFNWEAPDFEEHEYVVIWVDSDYLESCIVEGENQITYAAQIDAVEENSVINAIYPNPTSADLHINATAMKHITVFNAMGQMVYDQDVDADEIVLNMAQYEAGVYMVNVITENGTSVKRVTVTK